MEVAVKEKVDTKVTIEMSGEEYTRLYNLLFQVSWSSLTPYASTSRILKELTKKHPRNPDGSAFKPYRLEGVRLYEYFVDGNNDPEDPEW